MRSFLQGTTRIHFLQFRISGISDEIAAEVSLKLKVTKLEELVPSLQMEKASLEESLKVKFAKEIVGLHLA